MTKKLNEPIDTIEWEAPVRGKYNWPAIAEKVKAKPMTWAKVFDNDRTSYANAIRGDSISALKSDLGFEVTTSNNVREPVRMCSLFLRYNPDLDERTK